MNRSNKKKTIKINFKYFWDNFDKQDNFFTYTLSKMYHVEISDKPDYVFYSVYPEIQGKVKDLSKKGDFIKKISPRLYILIRKLYSKVKLLFSKNKPQVPKGNFIKIFYGGEHVKPNMNECDWAFSSHFENIIDHPNHMRIPVYVVSDYKLNNYGAPSNIKKVDFNKITKEKTNFCNFIYSQETPERSNFFKELSKYKHIDSPGRCMNNMPAIGYDTPKKSRASFNWVEEKLKFIQKYKFTIAFENSLKPAYVTEKLTHPMLVNSIPIYFGHKDVSKEFNTKSFINYNDFRSMKEFIDYIIKVDKDKKLYQEILNQNWYPQHNSIPPFSEKRLLEMYKRIFD